jgi:hypothetical protein
MDRASNAERSRIGVTKVEDNAAATTFGGVPWPQGTRSARASPVAWLLLGRPRSPMVVPLGYGDAAGRQVTDAQPDHYGEYLDHRRINQFYYGDGVRQG